MSDSLQQQLDALAAAVPGQVGYYARHLQTDLSVARAADKPQATMSAGKVFVLVTYADAVVRHQIDPSAQVTLKPDDMLPGTGALRYCGPGLTPTLSDLAALMITHSDNVATNVLLRSMGGQDAVNACLDRMAIHGGRCVSPLFHGDFSVSTPRALADVYAALMSPQSSGFSHDAAQIACGLLARSQDIEGMSRYLPWSPHAADFGYELPLTVYSKSGQFPGTQVEAGAFVTGKGTYVASVMCHDIQDPRTHSPAPGSHFLAEFGRLLFEAWGN